MVGFVVLCLLLFLVVLTPILSRRVERGRKLNRLQSADHLLSRAEIQFQTGELANAEASFHQALTLGSGDMLLSAEACYGLFRVCEQRGDMRGARQAIDAALSQAEEWGTHKPAFRDLLTRERQRAFRE